MKGIKIVVLKSFNIVYVCEIHVKKMVWHIGYIKNRNVREYLCKQKHKFL
jgi:hypothetical protein